MSQKGNAAPSPLDTETRVPVFEIRSASKYFGGVTAVQAVSLDVHAAEIVAIVGDNGAGKSTLIKAISGTQPPDEGTFFFRGQPVEIKNPQDASRLGIETVYQDLALCDNLDTVQNLFLGNEIISSTSTGRRLKHAAMEQLSAEVLRNLGVTTIRSLRTAVGRLSGGQRQGIAICRCIMRDPTVVLLDEPTAALGVEQRRGVVRLIRKLKEDNHSVIVISHDLHDVVLEVADRIVVLRLGRKVAEFRREEVNASDLVAAITGIRSRSSLQTGPTAA